LMGGEQTSGRERGVADGEDCATGPGELHEKFRKVATRGKIDKKEKGGKWGREAKKC